MVKLFFKAIIVFVMTVLARLVLRKYKPRVVGITGSVGKTAAKDAIYTVLASHFHVRKSEKSFNSEIGVPLTILGCDNAWSNPFRWLKNIAKGLVLILFPHTYPKWLVLEIGLDHPGDIARVVSWLSLDVAVFTGLAKVPVHVEFFDSPEELHKEKKLLATGLKRNGVLVYNADDPLLRDLRLPPEGKRVMFGLSDGVDIRGENYNILYEDNKPVGISFAIGKGSEHIAITMPGVLGRQQAYPALAACSVGTALGVGLKECKTALSGHKAPPGRMRVLEGVNGATIIDDTYNSSPAALSAAITAVMDINTLGKKIAVLGDMMELGTHMKRAHRDAGREVAGFDTVFLVGSRSRYIAEGALAEGMQEGNIVMCKNAHTAARRVRKFLAEGDIVLVKGSQSVRMERATEILLAYPEKKRELLVRQDDAWRARP